MPIACPHHRPDSNVVLKVHHHARKFDEADRFMTVMYTVVQPPVAGLRLREDFWTVFTPSKKVTRTECVMQTCYRIYVERTDEKDEPSNDAAELCSAVMTILSRLTRRNLQTTQNWLLDDTPNAYPEWVLF